MTDNTKKSRLPTIIIAATIALIVAFRTGTSPADLCVIGLITFCLWYFIITIIRAVIGR